MNTQNKIITITPPPISLKVSVEFEGDIIQNFVNIVEEDLKMHWDRLTASLAGDDPDYVNYEKKHLRRRIRELGLDFTDMGIEDWVFHLRSSIMIFYENIYTEDEYGYQLHMKIFHHIQRYLRTPEARAKLQELVDDDWLQELLEEKGMKAVNKIKWFPKDEEIKVICCGKKVQRKDSIVTSIGTYVCQDCWT